jgi:hypothetical protein
MATDEEQVLFAVGQPPRTLGAYEAEIQLVTSFRERVLPLGLGLDLRHHVWLVDPHPLQGRRPDEVGPLDPLQQGGVAFGFLLS